MPWQRVIAIMLLAVGELSFLIRLIDFFDKGSTLIDVGAWLFHPIGGAVFAIGGLVYWAYLDWQQAEAPRIIYERDEHPLRAPSRRTAILLATACAIILGGGLWWLLFREPAIDLLNVRIEMPAGISCPKRPERFPPGRQQSYEFMTTMINLTKEPMILDFFMAFQFKGKQIFLYGMKLERNLYLIKPDVINRKTGKTVNEEGLRIEPAQQLPIYVMAPVPDDVEFDVSIESVLYVADRISSKRNALPANRWTDETFRRGILKHGLGLPSLNQPNN